MIIKYNLRTILVSIITYHLAQHWEVRPRAKPKNKQQKTMYQLEVSTQYD